jgi:hypothetical protein
MHAHCVPSPNERACHQGPCVVFGYTSMWDAQGKCLMNAAPMMQAGSPFQSVHDHTSPSGCVAKLS